MFFRSQSFASLQFGQQGLEQSQQLVENVLLLEVVTIGSQMKTLLQLPSQQ